MTKTRQVVRWIAPVVFSLQSLFLFSDAFTSSFVWKEKAGAFQSNPRIADAPVGTATTAAAPLHSTTQTAFFDDLTAVQDDEGSDKVCTVQILMSKTGGGHLASAIALEDALNSLYPGRFECDIVDIYTDYGPIWPYNDLVRMYKLMAEYSFAWDLFYKFGETEFGLRLNEWMLDVFCHQAFTKCMERKFESTQKRADMVVSVHPLCQDLPLKILAELDADAEKSTPFATVVTDLGGAHTTWFNPDVDKCFVPSDALNEKAQSRGLDTSSQIVQYGLPIRKGFWPKSKYDNDVRSNLEVSEVRQELGLSDVPTVLVVGGGDGMGGIVDIASNLGKALGNQNNNNGNNVSECQMVVVCGNNQQAQQKLEKMNWPKGVEVNIQGFVRNMDEWMKASDCLVTKAGPGTIAEASICGLPCMLFAYLPGQEEGNVAFVEESGFGKYSSDPNEIAATVSSWLKSPEKLRTMQQAALSAARPSATLDIARDLAEVAFSTKEQQTTKKQQGEKILVTLR